MAVIFPKYEPYRVLLIIHNLDISMGPIRLGSESFIGLACIKIYSKIKSVELLQTHGHTDTDGHSGFQRA